MNHEQFKQFWPELRVPLQAKWPAITEVDLSQIEGRLDVFADVIQKRFGELHREEVRTWANRRYAHWSGNYVGYQDPAPEV